MLHRELHGAELRQAAAAAETLGGEDQVMMGVRTHDWKDKAHWTRVAPATGPTAHPPPLQGVSRQLNNKPHPSPMLKERLHTRHYCCPRSFEECLCVCVCACVCMCALLVLVCPSSTFVGFPRSTSKYTNSLSLGQPLTS